MQNIRHDSFRQEATICPQMPASSATTPPQRAPRIPAPLNACDAHIHIFDRRFEQRCPGAIMFDGSTVDHYRSFQQRIGTRRTVVVTPRAYATDNRVTLDAIQGLGATHTRGIAVVRPEITDAELQALHDGGIRGIRFTLYRPEHAPMRFDMVARLSERVHALGWHVQLHWRADQIVEHEAMLLQLPSAIVFDHLARLPMPAGTAHPAFNIVRRLLDRGRAWIKLSGPYLDSQLGTAAGYIDMDHVARAWLASTPERLVWGSDWPHATETDRPDDAMLFDLLGRWVDDARTRERILVDNAAQLYGFEA